MGILIVLVFVFTALTGVFADNSKSRGNENRSETGKLHAKNIKIQPRILLKGEAAEKFKKNKKADELLAIKGKPVKSICGPAATTYESDSSDFEGSLCVAGGDLEGAVPEFPPSGESVEWTCNDGKKTIDTCIAYRKDVEPQISLPECGPAATTYESTATSFKEGFCVSGTVESEPEFPLTGDSVDWNCILDGQTKNCTATVEEAGNTSTISATGILGAGPSADKHAIVIGICDYPDFLEYSDICESDGDAMNMTRALHTEYGFPVENIYLFRDIAMDSVSTSGESVISYPASRSNIMGAIETLKGKVGADSQIVFFFSGHGVTGNIEGDDEALDEALLVHNGLENLNKNKGEGQFEYIWDDELKDAFEGFATERITFIFDTCKAEGMNDVMEGFTTDENGIGRVFVAATEEDTNAYVYSSGEAGEGLFSHYFVSNGMRGYAGVGGGWADGYNQIGWDYRTEDGYYNPPVEGQDGLVTIEEAYEYAKDKLGIIFSSSEQVPTLEDFFTNDLLLGYWAD
jgi:hypothetical protein